MVAILVGVEQDAVVLEVDDRVIFEHRLDPQDAGHFLGDLEILGHPFPQVVPALDHMDRGVGLPEITRPQRIDSLKIPAQQRVVHIVGECGQDVLVPVGTPFPDLFEDHAVRASGV